MGNVSATQKTAAPPPTAAVGGRPLALKTRQRSVGGLKVKRRFKFIFLDGNTSVASPLSLLLYSDLIGYPTAEAALTADAGLQPHRFERCFALIVQGWMDQ